MRDALRKVAGAGAAWRDLRLSRTAFALAALWPAYALLAFAYSLAIGPLRGPDERNHFLRAYQISEGRLTTTYRGANGWVGDDLPASLAQLSATLEDHKEHRIIAEQLTAARAVTLEVDRREFIEFSTGMYAPLAYVPSAIAIAVGRAAGARPLTLLYAARWGNLIVAGLLIALALTFASKAAPAAAVVALFPMTLAQVGVVSADALSFGIAFLWIALVVDTAVGGAGQITSRRAFVLVALALALSQLRPPLPLLGLLALLLLRRGIRGATVAMIIAALAACIVPAVAWNGYAAQFYSTPLVTENVNPREQLAYVAENPGAFLEVVKRDLGRRAYEYWRQAVGRLGWLNLWLPEWIPAGFLAVFALALCCGPRGSSPPYGWQRAALAAAAIMGVLGVLLALYATFNGVGSRHVRGIQGRYFIPILFLAAFAASNQLLTRFGKGRAVLAAGCALFIACAQIAALLTVVRAAGSAD